MSCTKQQKQKYSKDSLVIDFLSVIFSTITKSWNLYIVEMRKEEVSAWISPDLPALPVLPTLWI